MMAGIRGKNTRPEMLLRRALHARGLRYRLHRSGLPGKPDLVFARYRAAIFVHGCFWHRHDGCRLATSPATRPEFWADKFAANVQRDGKNQSELIESGWRVAVVWECALKVSNVAAAADIIECWLTKDTTPFIEVPPRRTD